MGIGISTTVTDVQSKQINETESEYSSTCIGPQVGQTANIGFFNITGSKANNLTILSQSAGVNYDCVIENQIESVSEALSKIDAKARAENSAGFLQANINTNVTSVDDLTVSRMEEIVTQSCDAGNVTQTLNAAGFNITDSQIENSTLFKQDAVVQAKCKLALLSKIKNTTQKELSVDTSSGGNIITTLITGLVIVAILIASAIFAYKFANSEGGQKVIQAGIEGGKMAAGVPPGL